MRMTFCLTFLLAACCACTSDGAETPAPGVPGEGDAPVFSIAVAVDEVSSVGARITFAPSDSEELYCIYAVEEAQYDPSHTPGAAEYVRGAQTRTFGDLKPGTGYCAVAAAELAGYVALERFTTLPDAPRPGEEGSGERDGYRLVWQDLFDGEALDAESWNIEIDGNGNGNAELQYYRAENISIEDEPETSRRCLTITARRENYASRSFTSGRLTTQGRRFFRHGKVEALIRLPRTADGLWPAFWMMGNDFAEVGWPRCGEIDILEMGNAGGIAAGTQDRFFNGACHWGFYRDGAYPNYANHATAPYSLQDGFHLFTLVWDDEFISMYLDLDRNPEAEPYYRMGISETEDEWATGRYFHKDCFILFNLAVGGYFTGILDPAKITALPGAGDEARMYIDYVKVYQKQE